MAPTDPARIVATGIVLEEPADPAGAFAARHGVLTNEARDAIHDARAGHLVLLTVAPFADIDAGSGVQRYRLPAQGPHAIDTVGSATATLLALLDEQGEDMIAALAIQGVRVSRFDFYAAPHRIELDESIRRRLTLD